MTDPIISALCVTNRLACRGWLQWNVQRQTYPHLDVVIVDGSGKEGLHGPRDVVWKNDELGRGRRRVLRAPASWTCGQLRNLAMEHAAGEYFTWIDDDDWQHPERIEWLLEAIRAEGALWAGWGRGYLLKLPERRGAELRAHPPRVINGAALYRTEECRRVAYDGQPSSSDARWLRRLAAFHGTTGHVMLDDRLHSIWMRHETNTSRGLRGTPYGLTLGQFKTKAGSAWGQTEAWLWDLERALELAV